MFNIKEKKISSSPDLVTDLPIELVVKILKKKKLNFFGWNRIWINCNS